MRFYLFFIFKLYNNRYSSNNQSKSNAFIVENVIIIIIDLSEMNIY